MFTYRLNGRHLRGLIKRRLVRGPVLQHLDQLVPRPVRDLDGGKLCEDLWSVEDG